MNKLRKAIFCKLEQDKGMRSKEECILEHLIMNLKQKKYVNPISLSEFSETAKTCGSEDLKSIINYYIYSLKIFDLEFKLFITNDDSIELSEAEIHGYLTNEDIEISGIVYKKNFVGQNTFVFLKPRKRFIRII